jgi:MscS family membrane protein
MHLPPANEPSAKRRQSTALATPAIRTARRRPGAALGVSLICAASVTTSAAAQSPPRADAGARPGAPVAASSAPGPSDEVAPDSPRAMLTHFFELTRANRLADAAVYLDVPASEEARATELVGRFKAVLDRHVWIDLDQVSASSSGDLRDGLSPSAEQVAEIPGPSGRPEPVRLERNKGRGWLFARATVQRIDGWYEGLEHRWLREHLPPSLLTPGPKELLWWQWIAVLMIVFVAWAAGALLGRISRRVLTRVASRTSAAWDDALLQRLAGPLTLAWTIVLVYMSVHWLALYAPAQDFVNAALRGAAFVAFFWALARSVDVAAQVLMASPWGTLHPGSRSLVALAARTGKLGVLAMGVIALLSELGYPVASLVAGLGIGGLALALAAQKTVENLFGAFSIAADQPFREGDFVKIEDFVGTVEAIGLRSTRIRTLDRTLVSVPNGKLAEMRLESFTARDRIRLACVIGLVYDTTAAQMKQVLEGLERTLRSHPKIWPDAVIVRFSAFADSSLDIEIMAWFETADYGEFQGYRQEVLLGFMEIVEQAGTSFAFPTRTLHVIDDSPPEPEPQRAEAAAPARQ